MSDSYKLTRTYQKLVANTTINSETLLSTDYLNHFNELVMMFELVPDMPDMLEEAKDWVPKTYAEHFEASVFQHKDLAIAAYDHVVEENREALELTVARLNRRIEKALEMMTLLIAAGDDPTLRNLCENTSRDLGAMVDTCSAVINGVDGAAATALRAARDAEDDDMPVPSADAVDDPSTLAPEEDGEAVVMNQNSIDALFD